MQKICVIGGSRYFGKLLIERLQAAGHQVTVINRGSVPPPDGVEHLVADRNDEAALGAALDARAFDVVVDQVCYTPVQAAIAVRAFAGRTRRYVMTSTIEVYDPATAALPAVPAGTPVPEESVDPATWQVAMDLPWHDDAYLEAHYAEGKRQAEAVFAHAGSFAFTTVRSAHVLGGGAQEFTGRLAHYAGRITQGEEITVHEKALPTSSSTTRSWRICWRGRPQPTSPARSTPAPTVRSMYTASLRSSPRRPAGGSSYTGPSRRTRRPRRSHSTATTP